MIAEVLIQLRRYVAPSLGAIAVLLACDVVNVAANGQMVAVSVASMVRMVDWCVLFCFFAWELYRYANGGNDYFLLTLPQGPLAGLDVKVGAYAVILLAATLVEFPFTWHALSSSGVETSAVPGVACYDLGSRLLGIAAALGMVAVVSCVAAVFRSPVVSAVAALLMYVGFSVIQGCVVLLPAVRSNGVDFAIGVNSEFAGASQFVNILPVMVWDGSASTTVTAQSTVRAAPVIANVVVLILALAGRRFVVPRLKLSYIK